MTFGEYLYQKAFNQIKYEGRIDMCLASDMMAEGMDVPTIEHKIMEELDSE